MAERRPTDGWSDIIGDVADEEHPPSASKNATEPVPGGVDPVVAAVSELQGPHEAPPPGTSSRPSLGRPRRALGRVPHEDALGRVPHEDALGRVPHEDALGRVPHEDALGRVPREDALAGSNATGARPRRPVAPAAEEPTITDMQAVARPLPSAGAPSPSPSPSRLRLPRPEDGALPADAAPTPPMVPAIQRGPASSPKQQAAQDALFSSAGLVERLNDSTPVTPPKPEESRAYRELYITMTIGAVCLLGAFVFQFVRTTQIAPKVVPVVLPEVSPSPPVEKATPPAPRPPPAGPKAATAAARPRRTKPKKPVPTATPMLSIVTRPPGAIVDIDGVVYGRSPLIMVSPPNKDALSVTLKLPGHKNMSHILKKNKAGHFSLNVQLERTSTR